MENVEDEESPSSSQSTPIPRNQVHKTVDINGFNAVDLTFKKKANLQDPVVDMDLKINNPIGRIWEAIKRIWKSQKTTISVKFVIPLLVLPIVLFVGYRLWLGRGVNVPMAKVGIIHAIVLNGKQEHILVLPTSDAYLLRYSQQNIQVAFDTPMVVFGMYNHLNNVLTVEKTGTYNPTTTTTAIPTSSIWTPIASFLGMFQ